jgi:MSHA biogenesis protein MshO
MIKMKNNINHKGFTMVEMIIVISITGIIAAGVASFISRPIEAYEQTAKRAELADQAYLLVKKLKQDVRMSLPNSVRVSTSGNKVFLESLTLSNGGKYRVQPTSSSTGDILDFTVADTSFDVLSGAMTFKGGERIVVANIGSPGYDAYSLDNMTNYNGILNTPVNNISITAKKFPLESPGENFYVVDKIVSYVCDKDSKTLTKYWGYSISGTQPTNTLAAPLSSASSALIADNIFDCNFAYNQGANSRNGIVTIWVKLKNKEQEATLFTDAYVKNI